MTTIHTTRPSVLERARHGDAADFVRLYAPLAYSVARKRGINENDAEDLMQQAMLELLGLLPTFKYDRSRGAFKGLVKKIVLNRTVDFLRLQQRNPVEVTPAIIADAGTDMDATFEREWQKAHLLAALDHVRHEVKPTTFQSFQLATLCEWPIEKVASTLGLTANQVSQNKRRVIQRLRAHVQEFEREAT